MTPEQISAILGTGGMAVIATVIIPKLVDGINARRDGRMLREKEHNKGLLGQIARAERARDHAEEERDEAREQRDRAEELLHLAEVKGRKIAEYASRLRRQMYEAGMTPEPWPDDL